MAKNSNRSAAFMLILLFIGLVIGSFLGSILGQYFPILSTGYDFGVSSHTWDIGVLKLTFGFMLTINMFSVIGILIAYILYRKL